MVGDEMNQVDVGLFSDLVFSYTLLYFEPQRIVAMSMISGPSRLPRQACRVLASPVSRTSRMYASTTKPKSKGKKKFDPVIFTGIQPTGASHTTHKGVHRITSTDGQEHHMYAYLTRGGIGR